MSKIQNKNPSFNKTTLDNSHVYIRSLLTQKIVLKYDEVNSELFDILETKIKKLNEGKCIKEGYVKNNSVKLLTYSSGELFDNKILFECVFECLITNPVESTIIHCIAKSITKVGVRAELIVDDEHSPYVIFIARDHHYNNESFSEIKENDIIQVRILGQRYELNDKFISIIAELISINNYSTLKNELETIDTDENLKKIGGQKGEKKLKIKMKKSTHEAIINYN
jgi:DNA-directed RNA polymerase subunit E'/Rpb7